MSLASEIATYAGAGIGGYFGILTTLGLVANFCSERISDEEHFNEVVEEEARKLDLDTSFLDAVWIGEDDPRNRGHVACCKNYGYDRKQDKIVSAREADGKDIIEIKRLEISEGYTANRGAVRHELYHLKHHFPLAENKWLRKTQWFYKELAAEVYSVTGIKI